MKLGNKLFDIVVNILRNEEEARNNDVVLCWKVYEQQEKMETLTAREFFTLLYDKKVSSFSSITRARRAVQQHYPELRGEVYKKRHDKQHSYIKYIKGVPRTKAVKLEKERIKHYKESEHGSISM